MTRMVTLRATILVENKNVFQNKSIQVLGGFCSQEDGGCCLFTVSLLWLTDFQLKSTNQGHILHKPLEVFFTVKMIQSVD